MADDAEVDGNAVDGLQQCDLRDGAIVGGNEANNLRQESLVQWDDATGRAETACLPRGSDE